MNKKKNFVWEDSTLRNTKEHSFSGPNSCIVKVFSYDDLSPISVNESKAGIHAWGHEDFLSSLESGHLCLAVSCQGKWLAHAVFSMVLDEMELLILSVVPGQTRRGIAQSLLAEVAKQAKKNGINTIHLEVRASNQPAIRLYEKSGFKRVGIRKKYYSDDEDALLYTRCLDT